MANALNLYFSFFLSLSLSLSIYLSVCLYICLSVYLSFFLLKNCYIKFWVGSNLFFMNFGPAYMMMVR